MSKIEIGLVLIGIYAIVFLSSAIILLVRMVKCLKDMEEE